MESEGTVRKRLLTFQTPSRRRCNSDSQGPASNLVFSTTGITMKRKSRRAPNEGAQNNTPYQQGGKKVTKEKVLAL